MSGDGLSAIVATLNERIDRPVAFVNNWGDVLASTALEDSERGYLEERAILQEIKRSASQGLAWHEASGRWLALF